MKMSINFVTLVLVLLYYTDQLWPLCMYQEWQILLHVTSVC